MRARRDAVDECDRCGPPPVAVLRDLLPLDGLGMDDTWLERSFREEGGDYSLRHPWFDPLRTEPRFQTIWDELGLPGPIPEPDPA